MAKLIDKCKYCGMPAIEKSKKQMGPDTWLLKLECGHSIFTKVNRAVYDIVSERKQEPFPFQKDGMKFIEDTGFRCLIGDEMGLGKTVQVLGSLRLHPEMLPVLYIAKSGLKRQLEIEMYNWNGGDPLIQTVETSKEKVFPFLWNIISYDTLARIDSDDAAAKFKHIKTIVLDECQYIKNEDAKRTNAVRLLIRKLDIKNVIGMSGTPIKNKADEFFPILNMIAPTKFPSKALMMNRYFNYYMDGQGNYHIINAKETFYDALEGIMIRRTRAEVAPELPTIRRNFFNSEIENKELQRAYGDVQKEFDSFMDKNDGAVSAAEYTNLLGFFARMRRITGMAKIGPTVEFVTDFLLSTDRKIVVFGHHKETLEALKEVLDTWCESGGWNKCLALKSSMDADDRQTTVEKFKNDALSRVLIASTLASGEGLNLQFCSDAIMLERQWNPANEEQAETRFTRFGSTAEHVNITYMISVGTIDEWLSELVERKRSLISNVVDRAENNWEESGLMKELASAIYAKGGKRWSY
jgi:SWI/SNF-related matrix-associated actin-dependent regulator 1 of chromatin subfamily A